MADDKGTPDPKAPKHEPMKVDEKTGLTMHGDYPLSGPARARALAKAGKKSDPDGVVSPEAIAAHATDPKPPVGAGTPITDDLLKADFETIAKAENIDISGAKDNPDRARIITEARAKREAENTPPTPPETQGGTETEEEE